MLTKEECKVIFTSILSGFIPTLGRDVTQKIAINVHFLLRGVIKNTDVPPLESVPPLKKDKCVESAVRVLAATTHGLCNLTSSDTVVRSLSEISNDETFWIYSEKAIELASKNEGWNNLTPQEMVDKTRQEVQRTGGFSPFDDLDD